MTKNLLVDWLNKTGVTNFLTDVQNLANKTSATNVNTVNTPNTPTKPEFKTHNTNMKTAVAPAAPTPTVSTVSQPGTITGNGPAFVNGQLRTPANNEVLAAARGQDTQQSRFIGFQQQPQQPTYPNTTLGGDQKTLLDKVNDGKYYNILSSEQKAINANKKEQEKYRSTSDALMDFQGDVLKNNGKMTEEQMKARYPEFADKVDVLKELQTELRPIVQGGMGVDADQLAQYYPELLQAKKLVNTDEVKKKSEKAENTYQELKKRNDKILKSNWEGLSANGVKFARDANTLFNAVELAKQEGVVGGANDNEILSYIVNNNAQARAIWDEMKSLELTGEDKAMYGMKGANYLENLSATISSLTTKKSDFQPTDDEMESVIRGKEALDADFANSTLKKISTELGVSADSLEKKIYRAYKDWENYGLENATVAFDLALPKSYWEDALGIKLSDKNYMSIMGLFDSVTAPARNERIQQNKQNVMDYTESVNREYEGRKAANLNPDIENYVNSRSMSNMLLQGDLQPFLYKSSGEAAQNVDNLVIMGLGIAAPEIVLPLMAADSYARESQESFEELMEVQKKMGIPQDEAYDNAQKGSVLVGLASSAVELWLEKVLGGVETTASKAFHDILVKDVAERTTKMVAERGLADLLKQGLTTQFRASFEEGMEEVFQQAIHNSSLKQYDPDQKITEGMLESFEGGFYNWMNLLAGGGDVLSNVQQNSNSITQSANQTAYQWGAKAREIVDGLNQGAYNAGVNTRNIVDTVKNKVTNKSTQGTTEVNQTAQQDNNQTTKEKENKPGVFERVTDRGAEKITSTASAQDKLYKAQEPRMNVLSNKKNLERRRSNSDRANELIVQNGYKPTNTAERLEAHQNTLNKLWKQVKDQVNQGEGITVDQTPIIDALSQYIQEKRALNIAGVESELKALEKELNSMKKAQKEGKTDLPILENKKQVFNDIIDWKEQEASEVYKGGIKVITQEIGKIEDSMLSEIPGQFSQLKRDVGALLDSYEDVFKADMKNQRSKGLGLTETYSRIEGVGDIIEGVLGVLSGEGGKVVKGLGKLALGKSLAKAKNVDFLIKTGFEELSNEMKNAGATTAETTNTTPPTTPSTTPPTAPTQTSKNKVTSKKATKKTSKKSEAKNKVTTKQQAEAKQDNDILSEETPQIAEEDTTRDIAKDLEQNTTPQTTEEEQVKNKVTSKKTEATTKQEENQTLTKVDGKAQPTQEQRKLIRDWLEKQDLNRDHPFVPMLLNDVSTKGVRDYVYGAISQILGHSGIDFNKATDFFKSIGIDPEGWEREMKSAPEYYYKGKIVNEKKNVVTDKAKVTENKTSTLSTARERAIAERERLDNNGIKPAKSLPKGHKWTEEGSFTVNTPNGPKLTFLPIGDDLYIKNWEQVRTKDIKNTVIENYKRFSANELTNFLNDDLTGGDGDAGGQFVTEAWHKLGLPLGTQVNILKPLNPKERKNVVTEKAAVTEKNTTPKAETKQEAETKPVENSDLREKIGDRFYDYLQKQVDIINKSREGNPITINDLKLSDYIDKFEKVAQEDLMKIQKEIEEAAKNRPKAELTEEQKKQLSGITNQAERNKLLKKWQKEWLDNSPEISDAEVEKMEKIMDRAAEIIDQNNKARNYIYDLEIEEENRENEDHYSEESKTKVTDTGKNKVTNPTKSKATSLFNESEVEKGNKSEGLNPDALPLSDYREMQRLKNEQWYPLSDALEEKSIKKYIARKLATELVGNYDEIIADEFDPENIEDERVEKYNDVIDMYEAYEKGDSETADKFANGLIEGKTAKEIVDQYSPDYETDLEIFNRLSKEYPGFTNGKIDLTGDYGKALREFANQDNETAQDIDYQELAERENETAQIPTIFEEDLQESNLRDLGENETAQMVEEEEGTDLTTQAINLFKNAEPGTVQYIGDDKKVRARVGFDGSDIVVPGEGDYNAVMFMPRESGDNMNINLYDTSDTGIKNINKVLSELDIPYTIGSEVDAETNETKYYLENNLTHTKAYFDDNGTSRLKVNKNLKGREIVPRRNAEQQAEYDKQVEQKRQEIEAERQKEQEEKKKIEEEQAKEQAKLNEKRQPLIQYVDEKYSDSPMQRGRVLKDLTEKNDDSKHKIRYYGDDVADDAEVWQVLDALANKNGTFHETWEYGDTYSNTYRYQDPELGRENSIHNITKTQKDYMEYRMNQNPKTTTEITGEKNAVTAKKVEEKPKNLVTSKSKVDQIIEKANGAELKVNLGNDDDSYIVVFNADGKDQAYTVTEKQLKELNDKGANFENVDERAERQAKVDKEVEQNIKAFERTEESPKDLATNPKKSETTTSKGEIQEIEKDTWFDDIVHNLKDHPREMFVYKDGNFFYPHYILASGKILTPTNIYWGEVASEEAARNWLLKEAEEHSEENENKKSEKLKGMIDKTAEKYEDTLKRIESDNPMQEIWVSGDYFKYGTSDRQMAKAKKEAEDNAGVGIFKKDVIDGKEGYRIYVAGKKNEAIRAFYDPKTGITYRYYRGPQISDAKPYSTREVERIEKFLQNVENQLDKETKREKPQEKTYITQEWLDGLKPDKDGVIELDYKGNERYALGKGKEALIKEGKADGKYLYNYGGAAHPQYMALYIKNGEVYEGRKGIEDQYMTTRQEAVDWLNQKEKDVEHEATERYTQTDYETLPKTISVEAEAEKMGPKRIAPDRVKRQQETYDKGLENIKEVLKQSPVKLYELGLKSDRSKAAQDMLAERRRIRELPESQAETQWNELARSMYEDLVMKDISKGYRYPDEVTSKFPKAQIKKAVDARARYEKGLFTSFSNKDTRANYQYKDEIGAGIKSQDGKPVTQEQMNEIVDGIRNYSTLFGIDMKRFAEDNNIVYVHLHGGNPFLMGGGMNIGGLYRWDSSGNRSVSLGGKEGVMEKGEDGEMKKTDIKTTTAHELTHAVDGMLDGKLFSSADVEILKKTMNPPHKLINYFNKTPEIVARAVEQYAANKIGKNYYKRTINDIDWEKGKVVFVDKEYNYVDRQAYWNQENFDKYVKPIVEKNMKEKLKDYMIEQPKSDVTATDKNRVTSRK